MNSTLQVSGHYSRETPKGTDAAALRKWALGDLWWMWWRVGWAIMFAGIHNIRLRGRVWRDRERSRHLLTLLSHHELADMGLTPQQARWESSKPFWRA